MNDIQITNTIVPHICKSPYDPQYGYNYIQLHETVLIRISADQYDSPDIRLIKSDRNDFPGFGCRITEYEYKCYFKPV